MGGGGCCCSNPTFLSTSFSRLCAQPLSGLLNANRMVHPVAFFPLSNPLLTFISHHWVTLRRRNRQLRSVGPFLLQICRQPWWSICRLEQHFP
jgi:hypothetical protein